MIPGAIKTDNTIIPVTQCGNGLGLITATDTGGKTICSKFNSSTFEKKASGLPNIFFFFAAMSVPFRVRFKSDTYEFATDAGKEKAYKLS